MDAKPTPSQYCSCNLWCGMVIWVLVGIAPVYLFGQKTTFREDAFQHYRHQKDFVFRRLGPEQGLSNAIINDMLQDRLGFVWIATMDGLNRYDGYRFKVYKNQFDDPNSLSNNQVNAILEDASGKLWIGTTKGLNQYDPQTERFEIIYADSTKPDKFHDDNILSLHLDAAGVLWVGTFKGGLIKYNTQNQSVVHYRYDAGDPASLANDCVKTILEDKAGDLWLGTMNGLCRYDRPSGKFQSWRAVDGDTLSLSQDWVNALYQDPDGFLWAGTTHGLNRLDPSTGLFRQYWPNSKRPFWLGPNGHRIHSFFEDRAGNFWIGTQFGGLYRYDQRKDQFYRAIFKVENPNSLSNNVVTCFLQDREGMLWIGTENGLNLLEPYPSPFRTFRNNPADTNSLKDNKVNTFWEESAERLWIGTDNAGFFSVSSDFSIFTQFPRGNRIWRPMVTGLSMDSAGYLWMTTMGSSFVRMDIAKEQYEPHYQQPSNRNFIVTLTKTRDGDFWFGSLGGLNHYHFDTKQADYFPYAPEDPLSRMTSHVSALFEDSKQRLWVGTSHYGLKWFDREKQQYKSYPFGKEDGLGTKSASISFVFEDRRSNLWVGTSDAGFYLFKPETGSFRLYSVKNGLPFESVTGMVEDRNGGLWVATGYGLSRFDPDSATFRNYNINDGLPANRLSCIYFGQHTGRVYLGTPSDGFAYFYPDSLYDNPIPPPVRIVSLMRYRKEGSEMIAVEEKGVAVRDNIKLSYRDDILIFEIAALSFLKPGNNQYAYLLEGFNEQWIPLGNKREITLTNLDPGNYVLRVKASNGDGLWNEEGVRLSFAITPPWWSSWLAYAFYILLLSFSLYHINRFQIARRHARAESLRLKELDAFKTNFYTNITHEFRTPLTVISGIAEQIKNDPGRWLDEGTEMIKRNSDQLLKLVTQMLDLAKLEAGHLPLKMQQGDVVVYLKYLFESFHSLAASKNIQLDFETDQDVLVMDYDPEKLQQITSNLLSNAIKFTPPGGRVWMQITSDPTQPPMLNMVVGDTGKGIPDAHKPLIFDRFFRGEKQEDHATEGSGIGLALTKELVKQLDGRIEVRSRPGDGTVFTVQLPIKREARLVETQPVAKPKPIPATMDNGNGQKPLVLLVEDNADVATYITSCLEGHFAIDTAPDGQSGRQKAMAEVPDVIICDVMMPVMDGYELCKSIKTDIRTSHIPVVMLTAKADMASRLTGLEHGADVYLAKPFQKEELLAQIRNLLDMRRTLQKHYFALSAAVPPEMSEKLIAEENTFVRKVRSIVEANLENPAFDVERLCREINMSNSNLHRKLTALTGHPANHFIRHMRLMKACALLPDADLTIAAVAYDCGFNDPVYFARVFKQEFGVTPTEWRHKMHS